MIASNTGRELVIEKPEAGAGEKEEKKPSREPALENGGVKGEGESAPQPSRETAENGVAPVPGSEPRPEEEHPSHAEGAEAETEDGGEVSPHVQKRIKRATRKELLELIQRKNNMLISLDKEVKKTKQDLINKEDRLLRLAAEFENYKKRTRREWELLQKKANADLIMEIVGSIDNFDRAFENLGTGDSQLHGGIKLIQAGIIDVLKRAGVREIEALNQKFDPIYHEAVGELEVEGLEEGHVAKVIQKGYELNGQVLRPARVMVSKKKG